MKINIHISIWSSLMVLVIILLLVLAKQPSTSYYVDATLDDIPKHKVEAIVFLTDFGKEGKEVHALIGNPLTVKDITGEELCPEEPNMVFTDKAILLKTTELFFTSCPG